MKRFSTFCWWPASLLAVFLGWLLVYNLIHPGTALAAATTYKVTSATTIQAANFPECTPNLVFTSQSDSTFTAGCAVPRSPGLKYTFTISSISPDGSNYTGTIAANGGANGPNGQIDITGKSGVTLAGSGVGAASNSQAPQLICTLSANPLTWFMCPLISGMQSTIESLTSGIDSLLTVNTTSIFSGTATAGTTGSGFYAAWNSFRILAVGLIIIAGLIMLISQAIGASVVDAYTIRKVLPRLLLAGIFISLSWWILEFVVQMSNDVGLGVRSIIYTPFNTIGSGSAVRIGGGTATVGALVGGGVLLGLGLIGAGSFLLTALLAVFVGFIVLVLRQVVIEMLIVFAPLAISCYVLPGTEKVFKFWRDTLLSMLIVFPIISAFIAMGRVSAVVMYNSSIFILPSFHPFMMSGRVFGLPLPVAAINGVPDFVKQLGAFILFFLPYFLIPLAFRMAGGAMANLSGFVNDRHRGAFDRMKGFRKGQMASRGERFAAGSLYSDHAVARPLNALGRRVGAAKSGGGVSAFMGGGRGRAARALYDAQLAEHSLKSNPLLNELQNNDTANNLLALSGGTRAGLEQAANDLGLNGNARRGAIAAARAVGVNRANAMAALQTSSRNKWRGVQPGNVHAIDRGVRRVARSGEEYTSLAHQTAFFSRSNGRGDIGGTEWIDYRQNGNTFQLAQALHPGNQAAQWQYVSDQNMLDGYGRMGVQATLSGHDNQVIQTMHTMRRVLATAPAGSQQRVDAATALKEMHGNITMASGSARDEINRILYNQVGAGGLDFSPEENIAQQLADLTGAVDRRTGAPISGTTLTTRGRVYPEYDPSGRAALSGGGP